MLRKNLDANKERSERELTSVEFLSEYNAHLPSEFPRATAALMTAFREGHPSMFKKVDIWTLDQHRKKLMDWLPQHLGDKAE